MSNIYTLDDSHLGKGMFLISKDGRTMKTQSMVCTVNCPMNFMLVWSTSCHYCTQFKPMFYKAASLINHPNIKFSEYQVVHQTGVKIGEYSANTNIQKIEGVPCVVVFINQVAIENLGNPMDINTFLRMVKEIAPRLNSYQIRRYVPEQRQTNTHPASNINQEKQRQSVVLKGEEGLSGGNTTLTSISSTPGTFSTTCPLDNVYGGGSFTMNETAACEGGRCSLFGYEKGTGEGKPGRVNFMAPETEKSTGRNKGKPTMRLGDNTDLSQPMSNR